MAINFSIKAMIFQLLPDLYFCFRNFLLKYEVRLIEFDLITLGLSDRVIRV